MCIAGSAGSRPLNIGDGSSCSCCRPISSIPTELLPIAAGRVTFIRMVTPHGNIHLLSQTFWIGKRLKGQYVKAVLDTAHGYLTVYVQGRIFKRWPYRFLTK